MPLPGKEKRKREKEKPPKNRRLSPLGSTEVSSRTNQ
jgi:hypothetical protein